MTIILAGLNHRTAPIAIREQLALNGDALQQALNRLQQYQQQAHVPNLQEAVILSTCNRLEIYAVVHDRDAGWHDLNAFIASLHDMPAQDLNAHLYHLEGLNAVQHLMRVACGLDSMVLGESQILGQVAQAYTLAQQHYLTGPILSQVMTDAIHTAKRAHTETVISRFTTSISHAAALLLRDHMPMASPNILILGAGEMAVLAAKSLFKMNLTNMAFINRTYAHAQSLADEIGGQALSWYELADALQWADVVITATSAPHTVIHVSDLERALPQRVGRALVFVDIAVPRDVEVAVGDLPGIRRFDIDDLNAIVDGNTAQRQAAIPHVEAIIAQTLHDFSSWYRSREVTPIIKDLRDWASDIARQEVAQALNKLGDVDEHTEEVINRLAHRLVNKLLHEPTVRLREQAVAGNGHHYAHAVSKLFGLPAEAPPLHHNKPKATTN